MIQHLQAVRMKVKFPLRDDETPKMENCLRQIEGKLEIFRGLSIIHHRRDLIGKLGNPENMTLIFSAGF